MHGVISFFAALWISISSIFLPHPATTIIPEYMERPAPKTNTTVSPSSPKEIAPILAPAPTAKQVYMSVSVGSGGLGSAVFSPNAGHSCDEYVMSRVQNNVEEGSDSLRLFLKIKRNTLNNTCYSTATFGCNGTAYVLKENGVVVGTQALPENCGFQE